MPDDLDDEADTGNDRLYGIAILMLAVASSFLICCAGVALVLWALGDAVN